MLNTVASMQCLTINNCANIITLSLLLKISIWPADLTVNVQLGSRVWWINLIMVCTACQNQRTQIVDFTWICLLLWSGLCQWMPDCPSAVLIVSCGQIIYTYIDIHLCACSMWEDDSACILMHSRSVCTSISVTVALYLLLPNPDPVLCVILPTVSFVSITDRRGYNSPKRSTFLVDLHTWYLGGRGSLAGTLSCRWLLADRPCSPMPDPPLYRSGTCTHHSVPMLPGNVAWHVQHWSM